MIKQKIEVIRYKMVDLQSWNERDFSGWHEEIRLLILFLKQRMKVCEFMMLTFERCIFSLGKV